MRKNNLSLVNHILTWAQQGSPRLQDEKNSNPVGSFSLLPRELIKRYILSQLDFASLINFSRTSQSVRDIVTDYMHKTANLELLAYQMLTSQSPTMIDQEKVPMMLHTNLFWKAERAIRDEKKCPKRIEDRALYIKMVDAMSITMKSVFSTKRLKHDLMSHLSCCGERISRQPKDMRGLDLTNFDIQFYQPPKPRLMCESKSVKQPPKELRIYYKR